MPNPVEPTPQDLQAESVARDIAADMPSPYCPGRSIASCPSEAARELEDDILALAKQGKDREQIEGILVARFGEEKMGKAQQGEILVAILLAAGLALAFIVHAARKWLRSSPALAGPGSGAGSGANDAASTSSLTKVSADELDRLEDELDNLDGL